MVDPNNLLHCYIYQGGLPLQINDYNIDVTLKIQEAALNTDIEMRSQTAILKMLSTLLCTTITLQLLSHFTY